MVSRPARSELELDLKRYEVRCGSRVLRLERQPMELLILLASRPGELITRQEITARLWGQGVFVDAERGINNAVRKLRVALADDPEQPRYLETVIGKGYRLISPVTFIGNNLNAGGNGATAGTDALATLRTPSSHRHDLRFVNLIGVSAILMVTVVVLVFNVGRLRRPTDTPPAIRSLVVLPLDNLSGDPGQEYFVDGMTDELTTILASVPDLRVIPRTSAMHYKGTHKPLLELAHELNVDAVVEGSVVRSGDRVRITAQLIDPQGDRHLWAHSFESPVEDVLGLQDDIAQQITGQIQFQLKGQTVTPRPTRPISPDAHDAFLRGRYLFDRRSTTAALRSTQYFRQAIALDPDYAPAYAGLSRALASQSSLGAARPAEVMPEARAAAQRAVELDPGLSEAYLARASIEIHYDWDWKTGAQDLQRGLDLNPNNPQAEIAYSTYLCSVGRPREAIPHAQRALQLDPLSFFANRNLASVLYTARMPDQALAQLQRTKEIQENPSVIDNWISWTYEQKGMRDQAVKEDLKNIAADGEFAANLDYYRAAYARGGWLGYWRARVARMLPRARQQCTPYDLGVSYLRLGNRDEALRWLNRAVDQHCTWDSWIAADPKLDSLRSDPRFRSLLARMHL